MPKLIPANYPNFVADEIQESITEGYCRIYLYAGVHGDVIGDVPAPEDNTKELVIDAYHNMIFGKIVDTDDVSKMIRYIPWEEKVFSKYDDRADDLFGEDFYCQVDEGSFIHTYKCLDNNFEAVSNTEPQFAFVSSGANYIFQTSDGYVWKYMYSVTDLERDKFATDRFFPVENDANVSSAAVDGVIDVVHIEQSDLNIPGGGKYYNNYFNGTFATNQLRIDGNNVLYAISGNTVAFQAGYYTGCLIYLSEGIGVGQYTRITDYFYNANGNFIVLEDAFPISPQNGTEYQITPYVEITGSGHETVPAVARALVNSTGSNSIYKVEMLDKGQNYIYATANVIANSVITSDNNFVVAEVRPIYSPKGGHGFDCARELGSKHIEFSVAFSNNENSTIPATNRYQQFGLLRNPLFANVNIELANTVGSFQVDEAIYVITPIRINTNVSISNASAVITGGNWILDTFEQASDGDTGSYIPGDILTVDGGTTENPSQFEVLTTHTRTVAVNAAGTGYATSTTFTVECQVGEASPNATFTATTNSTGSVTSLVIVNAGVFTENPPNLNAVALVGGTGTGLTAKLTMAVEEARIFDRGAYTSLPSDTATNEPTSNTGDGAGAEFTLHFATTQLSDFQNQLDVGDYIYITSDTAQQLAVVNSITNATHMVIVGNGFFSCTAAWMYLPNRRTSATVLSVPDADHILVDNVNNHISTSALIVGAESGAIGYVNAISRNGDTKGFDTFVQLYKYDINMLSNNFTENEFSYQGNTFETASATALVHSTVTEGNTLILYTSNQIGQYSQSDLIHGANSLSVASINTIWSPELDFGSGEIIYIENVEPISRTEERTERFQIIVQI